MAQTRPHPHEDWRKIQTLASAKLWLIDNHDVLLFDQVDASVAFAILVADASIAGRFR